MKKIVRYVVLGVVLLFLIALGYAVYFVYWQVAPISAGYKAKLLCSAVFVAGRPVESVLAEELSPKVNPFLYLVSTEVDREGKSASATAFGLVTRTAVFREGLGCTIVPPGWRKEDLKPAKGYVAVAPEDPEKVPWPTGDLNASGPFPPGINAKKLAAAVEAAFAETDPKRPRRTRAVVVVYKGRIIAECYAPGFTKDTPQHGWSMSKSVTNAMVGILAGEDERALEIIDEQIEIFKAQLKRRQINRRRWERQGVYVSLIAELGITQNEMYLEWLCHARAEIEKSLKGAVPRKNLAFL